MWVLKVGHTREQPEHISAHLRIIVRQRRVREEDDLMILFFGMTSEERGRAIGGISWNSAS